MSQGQNLNLYSSSLYDNIDSCLSDYFSLYKYFILIRTNG